MPSFYVDDLADYDGTEWCHLWTDGSTADLLAFGAGIGLRAEWLQISRGFIEFVHFDLRASKRIMAVKAGAVETTLRSYVAERAADLKRQIQHEAEEKAAQASLEDRLKRECADALADQEAAAARRLRDMESDAARDAADHALQTARLTADMDALRADMERLQTALRRILIEPPIDSTMGDPTCYYCGVRVDPLTKEPVDKHLKTCRIGQVAAILETIAVRKG